jgi:hypothetical protein
MKSVQVFDPAPCCSTGVCARLQALLNTANEDRDERAIAAN